MKSLVASLIMRASQLCHILFFAGVIIISVMSSDLHTVIAVQPNDM